MNKTNNPLPPNVLPTGCSCGKISHVRRRKAEEHMQRLITSGAGRRQLLNNVGLQVYACPSNASQYHVGHAYGTSQMQEAQKTQLVYGRRAAFSSPLLPRYPVNESVCVQ